jgi:hypothetical protein
MRSANLRTADRNFRRLVGCSIVRIGGSVTHVSGTFCHLCLGPLTHPSGALVLPFCQGEAGAIGLSRMPMARNRRVTTRPSKSMDVPDWCRLGVRPKMRADRSRSHEAPGSSTLILKERAANGADARNSH